MSLKLIKPTVLEPNIIVIIEIIHADDLVTLIQQFFTDLGSNKPPGTGDQVFLTHALKYFAGLF